MVRLQRVLERIEFEKQELKERRIKIPSQLSKSAKSQERKEISSEMLGLSKKEKETKREKKEGDKKRKEILKRLGKLARKKVPSRRTFKKSKTTLHLNNPDVPSILGEPNRFFKDEMEEAKRSLFFT